jgi:hypothetical protein
LNSERALFSVPAMRQILHFTVLSFALLSGTAFAKRTASWKFENCRALQDKSISYEAWHNEEVEVRVTSVGGAEGRSLQVVMGDLDVFQTGSSEAKSGALGEGFYWKMSAKSLDRSGEASDVKLVYEEHGAVGWDVQHSSFIENPPVELRFATSYFVNGADQKVEWKRFQGLSIYTSKNVHVDLGIWTFASERKFRVFKACGEPGALEGLEPFVGPTRVLDKNLEEKLARYLD